MPKQIECCHSLEIFIVHLAYCGNFQQDYHKNGVIFGQKVSLNDQSMLHGILIKIDILFAQITPAERPLTVSGPFTGMIVSKNLYNLSINFSFLWIAEQDLKNFIEYCISFETPKILYGLLKSTRGHCYELYLLLHLPPHTQDHQISLRLI